MVANEFLAGHDQTIAASNAKGSNGMKEPADVLGKNIAKKMQKIKVAKYKGTPDEDYWKKTNPTKVSNNNAKLNRIKAGKVIDKDYEIVQQLLDATITKSTESIAIERTSEMITKKFEQDKRSSKQSMSPGSSVSDVPDRPNPEVAPKADKPKV